MPKTATSRVTVSNRLGLHARPAMEFVERASVFACDVRVRRVDADEIVDGKSIMQMMLLAATVGTELEIECEGDDAKDACEALIELVSEGFGEG
jgi:phosphocarrier protein HPr